MRGAATNQATPSASVSPAAILVAPRPEESIEMILDPEDPEEVAPRIGPERAEPRRDRDREKRQPDPRPSPQNLPRRPRPDDPGDPEQAGEDEADEALREEG